MSILNDPLVTTVHDLSGPAQALYSEALAFGDPAGYLRTADDWLPEDRRRVAEVLGVSCPGCVGCGTGLTCCMCSLPIPERLRRRPGDPGEFPGVAVDGWPFQVAGDA